MGQEADDVRKWPTFFSGRAPSGVSLAQRVRRASTSTLASEVSVAKAKGVRSCWRREEGYN